MCLLIMRSDGDERDTRFDVSIAFSSFHSQRFFKKDKQMEKQSLFNGIR